MKRLILISVTLFGSIRLHAQSATKDFIQTLMYHIMHRESAAILRFDQAALQIMKQDTPIVREMSALYKHVNTPHIYKITSQSPKTAHLYPHSSLVQMAQEDLNYCTRFLKLLKKYCGLFITDIPMSAELSHMLCKSGTINLTISQSGIAIVDELTKVCKELLHNSNDFMVIITALRGISPLVHHRLIQEHPNLFIIDISDLIELLTDVNQQVIDYQRFCRLMRRNIIVMSTAAIISGPEIYRDFDRRKAQYIKSIEALYAIGYEPYIVEACATGPTFLDEYCHQVLYTHSNDPTLVNKGVNEAKSILIFLDTYKDMIHDDDIIVKTTGRYYCGDDSFIRLVEDNDTFVGFARHRLKSRRHYTDVYTGIFALEARYFTNMLSTINYDRLDASIFFEWDVARYLHTLAERHVPIMYLDRVNMYYYKGPDDKEKYR